MDGTRRDTATPRRKTRSRGFEPRSETRDRTRGCERGFAPDSEEGKALATALFETFSFLEKEKRVPSHRKYIDNLNIKYMLGDVVEKEYNTSYFCLYQSFMTNSKKEGSLPFR